MKGIREHLKKITRTSTRGADRLQHHRLDRNERTSGIPRAAFEEMLSGITPDFLTLYPESGRLYKKMARWIGVSENQILLTNAADLAIKQVYEVTVNPGDEVVIQDPTYAMYPVYTDMFQGKAVKLGFNDDLSFPLERILDAINAKTKLVCLANPNQPIESYFGLKDLERIASKAEEHGAYFLVDEAYYHFCDVTAVPLLKDHENVVIVRTFSKAFGLANLRIGYLLSTERNIADLTRVKPINEANGFAMHCAEYLIDHFEHVQNYVDEVAASRRMLKENLAKLDMKTFSDHGNSMVIELPRQTDVRRLNALLLNDKFLVKGPFDKPLDHHLRITLGTRDLMEKFWESFRSAYQRTKEGT